MELAQSVESWGTFDESCPSAVHVDRFRKSHEEFWTTCTIMSRGWFSVLSKYWNHQRAFKKVSVSHLFQV